MHEDWVVVVYTRQRFNFPSIAWRPDTVERPIALGFIVTVTWMETVPFGQVRLKWPVTWSVGVGL